MKKKILGLKTPASHSIPFASIQLLETKSEKKYARKIEEKHNFTQTDQKV